MNLRDEIIQIVATRDAETGYTWSAEQIADALLPIVERVAREAAQLAISDRHSEAQEQAIIDDIVRRVCGE